MREVVSTSGRWVAKSGRWVAKSGRCVAKSGRWVAKLGRWVATVREIGGYVGSAPACYGSSLSSNPDISLKNTKWADLADFLYVVSVHDDGVDPEGLHAPPEGLHVVLEGSGVGLAQPGAKKEG